MQADLDEGDFDDLVVPSSDACHLSTDTIIDLQRKFRDIIAEETMNSASSAMVGGHGCTCEIDESMFGWCSTISSQSSTFI